MAVYSASERWRCGQWLRAINLDCYFLIASGTFTEHDTGVVRGADDNRRTQMRRPLPLCDMGWIDAELVLVMLAAMMSPTTLTFSVLALVLGDQPRRTGLWFYVGALSATLGVGVIAAFVLGDKAASDTPSQPRTWVAIVDIVAAAVLLGWVLHTLRRPPDRTRVEGMVARMSKVANSPVIAIVGAGAALANPGGFIPLALKDISETDPTTTRYIVEWVLFSLVSLLPLAIALVMLRVDPHLTKRVLQGARDWLVRDARKVAAVIVVLLAASLLRNGIAGLAG